MPATTSTTSRAAPGSTAGAAQRATQPAPRTPDPDGDRRRRCSAASATRSSKSTYQRLTIRQLRQMLEARPAAQGRHRLAPRKLIAFGSMLLEATRWLAGQNRTWRFVAPRRAHRAGRRRRVDAALPRRGPGRVLVYDSLFRSSSDRLRRYSVKRADALVLWEPRFRRLLRRRPDHHRRSSSSTNGQAHRRAAAAHPRTGPTTPPPHRALPRDVRRSMGMAYPSTASIHLLIEQAYAPRRPADRLAPK